MPTLRLRPRQRHVKHPGERAILAAALIRADGNVAQAARALGTSRETLYMRCARYWPSGHWPCRRRMPWWPGGIKAAAAARRIA